MLSDLVGWALFMGGCTFFGAMLIRGIMDLFPAESPPPPPLPLSGQCYVVPGIGVVRVTGAGPSKVHYTHSDGANAFATIADWNGHNPTLITTREEALLEAAREVEEILNAD